jgi:hypothetical protein
MENKVVGMSLDTTSSNVGNHKGAFGLLEKLLNRNLFRIASRHHINELIVEATFVATLGPSLSNLICLKDILDY